MFYRSLHIHEYSAFWEAPKCDHYSNPRIEECYHSKMCTLSIQIVNRLTNCSHNYRAVGYVLAGWSLSRHAPPFRRPYNYFITLYYLQTHKHIAFFPYMNTHQCIPVCNSVLITIIATALCALVQNHIPHNEHAAHRKQKNHT